MTPEAFFIDYLTTALTPPPVNGVPQAGVPVSGSVPHAMPAEFVTVELTGSGQVDKIDRVTVSSPVKNEVSRCELETGYNDTDTETHRPRYHARYGIVYLGGN